MAKIESEIGSVSVKGKMKNYEVSDESDSYEEDEFEENPFEAYESHYMKHREGQKKATFDPNKEYVEVTNKRRIVPPVRNHFVANDEETLSVEEQVAKLKQQKKTYQNTKLSDFSRKRLDLLIGMSKLTREIDIEGTIFELQSLSSGELREVYIQAEKYNNTVQFPYELRRQILSKSLIKVAGLDIYDFLGNYEYNSKLILIDNLGESFVSRLFDEYNILSNEANTKYAIKTEEQMKEVLEDLKK
jgi:hypothetical protein